MPQYEQERTSQLVRQLYQEGNRLAHSEIELAKRDLAGYVKRASLSIALLGLSGTLLFGSFVVLSMATGMAISRHSARGTSLVGSLLGTGGAGSALLGLWLLPKRPWASMKERLRKDVDAAIDALH